MTWFGRKPTDPLTARQNELEAEMNRLEVQLKRLTTETSKPVAPTRSRRPAEDTPPFAAPLPVPTAQEAERNGHYNEFGVRKFDVSAAWQRLKQHVQGPTGNNPQLVKMLAAGNIHGLRPLRYEKRVARNRFIALFLTLLGILLGIAHIYLKNSS